MSIGRLLRAVLPPAVVGLLFVGLWELLVWWRDLEAYFLVAPSKIVGKLQQGPAEWYPAQDYHQEYWDGEGQRNPYCLAVIPPKLMKLRKSFANKVKSETA